MKIKKRIRKLVCIGVLMCTNLICSQVIDFKKDTYWVSFGGGLAKATGDTGEACLDMSFSHVKGSSIMKARILAIYEVDFFGSEPLESSVNFGVLIGRINSKKYSQTSYLVGLGLTTGSRQGKFIRESKGWFSSDEYEMKNFLTLSIPAEVEFVFKPIKFIGIGLGAFVDLNIVRPSVGARLNISIGKLR